MTSTFKLAEDHIESVLRDYSLRVANTNGESFADMAGELIHLIDAERVERVANAYEAPIEQAQAALEEIKDLLVEHGVLEF